jgi:small subunit ribosomal protein S6
VSRDYELGFILNPEVSEEEIRSLLDRIEQIVANYGGQIFKVNQWGRRRLAYPIERHRDGFYIFIDMILTPETVTEIERTLRVSELVFRHMMKRRDPKAAHKEREARAAAQAEAASRVETPAAPVEAASRVETPATPVEAESQAETPAAPVEAASRIETSAALVEAETPAVPVEAASRVETPVVPVEAESQAETPVEGKADTEEVAAITIAEESVVLSPEEIESAPPAVEESEAIEA